MSAGWSGTGSNKLVVEDTGAALTVAVDGRPAPGVATRTRDAIAIKADRDGARRAAFDILAEDAAHDLRLIRVDEPIAPVALPGAIGIAVSPIARLVDPVAITQAAPRAAMEDAAFEPAPHLFRQERQSD